jgi:hypothetical protein
MRTIGFAGTAKNTGKTTAALKVLEQSLAAGFHIALTSIGLDGENTDHITGLPKPRYFLQPGILVATAEDCLRHSQAHYQVIRETGVFTTLGQIFIIEIKTSGSIALAGPNRKNDLADLLKTFMALGIDLVILDGALNRLVPLICADSLILSTGAAFDENLDRTVSHAKALLSLFTFQKETDQDYSRQNITIFPADKSPLQLGSGSLLSENMVRQILENRTPIEKLVIPGACYPNCLQELLMSIHTSETGLELVLGNPLNLIASGDPLIWVDVLSKWKFRGVRLKYLDQIPILFLTINPFYPRYDPERYSYQPAYVDKDLFLIKMKAALKDFPVLNMMDSQTQDIFELIEITKKGTPDVPRSL